MKTKITYKLSLSFAILIFYANLQAQNKVLTTNFGHTNDVNSVSFSPNGKILASASWDNTIKLWDVKSGREIRTLERHTDGVNSVSFSPNGKILASASWDNTIKLWNIESGREIRTLERHTDGVNSVSFSPNGKMLASASNDSTIKLWNVESGQEIRTLKGYNSSVSSVSFSPNGKILASNSYGTIKLWDIESGLEIRTLERHTDGVNSVSFSPNGKILASNSYGTIKLWNIETGQEIRTLEGHTAWVTSVSLSPSGKVLALGSWDKTIELWNIETGQEIRTLKGHTSDVNSVSFSPNGKMLASGGDDKTIKLWNMETGQEIRTLKGHTSGVNSVSFSPNGKILASGNDDNTIKLWNIETELEIRTLKGHTDDVWSVSFSPNGKILASGSYDKTIKLWNIKTGQEIRTLKGHTSDVNSVSFSPNGKILASDSGGFVILDTGESKDNFIKLWNMETGREIRTLKGHKSWVNSVVFSPNGKMLASGSRDCTVKLWNIETGQEIRILKGHKSGVNSVSFSQSGKILASGSSDNTIKLWNIETGQEIRTLKGHKSGVNSVNFGPNGKILASGSWDNTIKLWDVETGQKIRTLIGHTDNVESVSFSQSGKILASGSIDGTTKLWDTESGKLLATLVGMNESGNYDWVIYTPQGKYEGVNCNKYLHYVKRNKIYKLPRKDPNYEKDLLIKIFNKYNSDDIEPVKPVVVDDTKPEPQISIKDNTPPNIILHHSEYVTTENKTFTISGEVTDESGVLLISINRVEIDIDSINGLFEHTINLKEGQNRFQIKAMDSATNRTIKNIIINYEPKRKDIALLFYVSEYSDSNLPSLKGTRKNAEKLGKVLKNNYGFETHVFANYTETEIKNILKTYSNKNYSDNDQLLIYFSGHGKSENINGKTLGSLICADDTKITHAHFKQFSSITKCNHILLVVDACFSGLLIHMIEKEPPPYEPTREEVFKNLFAHKSARKILTSGDGTTTIAENDMSDFTKNFIKVLKEEKGVNQNILTYQEISGYFKVKYKKLKFGAFNGNDNSDARFLFIKKQ